MSRYGYARQAALYADGLTALGMPPTEFCFVVVENGEPPYGVRSAPIGEQSYHAGRQQYRKALAAIRDYRAFGACPGYENPSGWELPAWELSTGELELSISGETFLY